MKAKLLFTESAMPLILEAFGKEIKDGFIVESDTGEFVLTPDGEEIEAVRFGGIKNGMFLKDDLHSIINLVENKFA